MPNSMWGIKKEVKDKSLERKLNIAIIMFAIIAIMLGFLTYISFAIPGKEMFAFAGSFCVSMVTFLIPIMIMAEMWDEEKRKMKKIKIDWFFVIIIIIFILWWLMPGGDNDVPMWVADPF